MSEEKPLHVRVAEALGWTDLTQEAWPNPLKWGGIPPGGGARRVPHYDLDWAASGPLIDLYKISLRSPLEPERAGDHFWEAYAWDYPAGKPWTDAEEITGGSGKGPLVAVCALLLKLSAAGKL